MDISEIEKASQSDDEGFWQDAQGIPGVRLKVRSAIHPVVKRAYGRALRQAPDAAYGEDGQLTDDASAEIDRQIFPKVVLLDWEGITKDGDDWPCTPENAERAMQSSAVVEAVRIAAQSAAVSQSRKWEEMAGNSPKPSRPKTRGSK